MVASGNCGRGKTNTIKNLFLAHQSTHKPFKELHIVTCSINSREWDDCDPTSISEDIPDPEYFTGKKKCCLILDDYEYSKTNKNEIKNLTTLFRFTSTHRNLSIITTYQAFTEIPQIARKCANTFLLYKPRSKLDLGIIANRCGVSADNLKQLFSEVANGPYDSLFIDCTINTPYPIRKNIYEPIEYNEDSD
jgi:hypothetical protein